MEFRERGSEAVPVELRSAQLPVAKEDAQGRPGRQDKNRYRLSGAPVRTQPDL